MVLATGFGQHDRVVDDGHQAVGERVVEDGMAWAVAPPRLDRVVIRAGTDGDPVEELSQQRGRRLYAP